ncbi:MAG: ribosome biogenesis GTP-binding protein YihA/YsxC [Chromatiaceae bacterium]
MNPIYQRVRFLAAAARLDEAPPDEGREVAFAGRSNAGKSSAINALCHQRRLARISKTPGRTQQLVFFALDDARRLVDLPGYGYAKVSETVKAQWQALMAGYLQRRRSLAGLVLVMDIRHPLTAFDSRMLAWCRQASLPLLLLLTKADKLGRGSARTQLERVKGVVAGEPGQVEAELFSAQAHQGVESVHALLDQWLALDGIEDGF